MTTAIKKTSGDNGIFQYVEAIDPLNYPSIDWEQNPDINTVTASGVSRNYWKYNGTNTVVEMSQSEKDAVDLLLIEETTTNISSELQMYSFTETFIGNEVRQITIPVVLNDTTIVVSNPNFLELGNETLLSASGSGPVGWDPGNRGTLESVINDGNLGNFVYNNSTSGNTSGYIIGIDMLTPTTINSLRFLEHSSTYFNTVWEFIGSNDATAGTYDVLFSGTSSAPHNPIMFSRIFNDEIYRYYGVRCVTSNNSTFAILREMELSTGTLQTVEKQLTPTVEYTVSKINNTTFEITNLSGNTSEFKIVIIGKQ